MKYLLPVISFFLLSLMVSCSKEDEPVTPPQYRISWLHFDGSYELFEYDASERISRWEHSEEGTDVSYVSSYSYPDEGNVIAIASEEKTDIRTWIFNERLYLNQDGTASNAEGTAILNEGNYRMTKNYTVTFQYNSSRQLVRADIAERRINSYGQEEQNALEWTAELKWDDDNLVGYSEYSNPAHPMVAKTFAYFGGNPVQYMPIVQGPVVRSYYLPLQYQGILGKCSPGLVKTMEVIFSDQSHSTTEYSYNIAASVYSSFVEEYSALRDGKELKYTVGWDQK